ncbi:Uncharacterized protein FKW44_007430, partial [Caligus rogercresseyi]
MNESSSGEEIPPQSSYVKALKKDLASKAMKSKIIIDLSTINGSRAPKRPTIQEIENLVIGTLKLNPRSLQGIHTCPGARSILILVLKNELNIGTSFSHVEDTFIIRNGSTSDDGIKGTVRGLRAQRKDTDGNPIIYEKNVIVHSPHEDVKAKDIEEVLLNFGEITRPAKECNFLDGKLKGLYNGNFTVGVLPQKDVPGFLGFKGYKTRISFSGQSITCAKCYDKGHFARDCPNKFIKWTDYWNSLKASFSKATDNASVNDNETTRLNEDIQTMIELPTSVNVEDTPLQINDGDNAPNSEEGESQDTTPRTIEPMTGAEEVNEPNNMPSEIIHDDNAETEESNIPNGGPSEMHEDDATPSQEDTELMMNKDNGESRRKKSSISHLNAQNIFNH